MIGDSGVRTVDKVQAYAEYTVAELLPAAERADPVFAVTVP
jgi:hypothetical protein